MTALIVSEFDMIYLKLLVEDVESIENKIIYQKSLKNMFNHLG